jgi:PKD repeat protein
VTPNQAPRLAATVSAATGYAPMLVRFSSAGSFDPEGGALRYFWNFGEGHSSTAANASYTYKVPGTYTASLTIVDPFGQQTKKSFTITVKAPTRATATFTLTKVSGAHAGTAIVSIKDVYGRVVVGARITGVWGGVATATTTLSSSLTGRALFASPRSTRAGTLTFTVTKVVMPPAWAWDNVKRSRSIAV